ncbi:uncharacterized protein [Choristoneura fumiferana]|uniref:uncharacterized protein n=1 Tax=Choristoneura fumiferana TaxID=7141 RepID=UPI003D15BD50
MSRKNKMTERTPSKDEENEITETIDILVFNYLSHDLSKMCHDTSCRPEKNTMIMFNHNKFLDKTTRPWSNANKRALKDTLEKMNFRGHVHDNMTRRDLTKAVREFALDPDISNCGYVCVAILTHGHEKPGYFRSYNRWYNECEVFKHFDVVNNSALAAKPIIFIIQASRGANAVISDCDGAVGSRRGSKPDRDLEEKIDYHLPADATRIVFHSSYTGGAYDKGSWLTQALCEKIGNCSSEYDLMKLFGNAWQSPKWLEQSMEWTQTLSLTSTVTRHIYLKNKKAEESFPPDEEDDEDIENNSISYTPVTNSQNSKNDCTVASPQSSFMNGGIQRGSTFESLPATYELDKFQKNAMVIFNHEKYAQRDVSPRIGTEYDKNALKKTFQRFRFEVTTYDDLSKEELLSKLTEFGGRDFSQYGCVCVTILTHGDDHGMLLAADADYREREVFACFNSHYNSTLACKPIIFLIQACRGRILANSASVNAFQRATSLIELDADLNRLNGYCLPTEADMIIFHSCFFGKASVRTLDSGTWFIQTICELVNQHAPEEHLEKIFRRVRTEIALKKEFQNGKQMPVTSSTLLRKLYFAENYKREE